jgi:hypothetical protein
MPLSKTVFEYECTEADAARCLFDSSRAILLLLDTKKLHNQFAYAQLISVASVQSLQRVMLFHMLILLLYLPD